VYEVVKEKCIKSLSSSNFGVIYLLTKDMELTFLVKINNQWMIGKSLGQEMD